MEKEINSSVDNLVTEPKACYAEPGVCAAYQPFTIEECNALSTPLFYDPRQERIALFESEQSILSEFIRTMDESFLGGDRGEKLLETAVAVFHRFRSKYGPLPQIALEEIAEALKQSQAVFNDGRFTAENHREATLLDCILIRVGNCFLPVQVGSDLSDSITCLKEHLKHLVAMVIALGNAAEAKLKALGDPVVEVNSERKDTE